MLIKLLRWFAVCVLVMLVVDTSAVPTSAATAYHPDGAVPFPIGDGATYWFTPIGSTIQNVSAPYVLEYTFNVSQPEPSTYDFSIAVTDWTDTDAQEMDAFHLAHQLSTSRTYADYSVYRGIGNVHHAGVGMNYISFSPDGSAHRTGSVAIVNRCGKQYTYEIFAEGDHGTFGENFGAMLGQTDFIPCAPSAWDSPERGLPGAAVSLTPNTSPGRLGRAIVSYDARWTGQRVTSCYTGIPIPYYAEPYGTSPVASQLPPDALITLTGRTAPAHKAFLYLEGVTSTRNAQYIVWVTTGGAC